MGKQKIVRMFFTNKDIIIIIIIIIIESKTKLYNIVFEFL